MSLRPLSPRLAAPLLSLGVLAAGCAPAPLPPAPVEVVVSPPVERRVVDYLDFTGRTQAKDSVQVRSRIGGYLQKIDFKDGEEVKEGQLLFEIDDRAYRAAGDAAQAQVNLNDAQLKEAEAEYRRDLRLRRGGTVSQEDLEKAQRARDTARATLEAARADLRQKQLDLDYTRITAPVAGRADRANVTVGNLISADASNATPLTSIVTLQPMYVYFTVDESTLLWLRQLVREGKLPAPDEKPPEALAGVGQGDDYPFRGTVDYISNRVDPATGTLEVRASFPNKDDILRPGLFARVRLPVADPRPALLVSDSAVGSNQGKKYVYVVDDKDEVVSRPVKLGALSDGLRIVEEGLNPKDRVIVEGMLRVRPGLTVRPKAGEMTPAPAAAAAPPQ